MDDVKSQMEGVSRVYNELDNKVSDQGGVQNLFGMNAKFARHWNRSASANSIRCLPKYTAPRKDSTRLQEDVVEIRVLKIVLSSPASKQVNGQARL